MTPSTVWPRRFAALYTKTGIASGVFLGHAQDFFDRGEPLAGAPPAVHAQRDHARRDRVLADVAGGRAPQHEAPSVFRDGEQLVDAHPASIAGAPTLLASLAAEQAGARRGRH